MEFKEGEIHLCQTLYSMSAHNKVKKWIVQVIEYPQTVVVKTEYGYEGDKMQTSTKVFVQGKNLGKANETTPLEQAVLEAQSKIRKKMDEGYRKTLDDSKTIVLPMLATRFTDRKRDISYPCFVQPKLDGVRCIWKNGRLYSRYGKEFSFLDHICRELEGVDMVLDGELYSTAMSFQQLSGLVRKKKYDSRDEEKFLLVSFHVFDVFKNEPFYQRFQHLQNVFSKRFNWVQFVQTERVESEDAIYSHLYKYEKQGYEGIIIRNQDGMYQQNARSKHLQKLKSFTDEEFEIVGFKQGEGGEEGCVIWECATVHGQTFMVRPQGTLEARRVLFQIGEEYIGKLLTVRFQEYTDCGIPRFPTGIEVRDYE